MTIQDYIQKRVDIQIEWYEKKAAFNKFRYRIIEIIIIVSGALIPFINSITIFYPNKDPQTVPYPSLLFISSLLGFIITLVTGFSKMEKYFESWTLYRTNAEVLKKEKFLYLNSAGQYSKLPQEDRDKLLVENIEFILSSEVTKYFSMQEKVRQTVLEERKTEDNKKIPTTSSSSSPTSSTLPTPTTPPSSSSSPTPTTPSPSKPSNKTK
jgi:hypothetical protein